jgi:hypothetical protein
MARTTTQPAQTISEDIRGVEEFPPSANTPGIVRVMVGRLDAAGAWITPQQYESYVIEGADYDELVGPAPTWAPDKPAGTYRNDDLWHYIDLQRQAAAA